mgnify:CR=1 FL=1
MSFESWGKEVRARCEAATPGPWKVIVTRDWMDGGLHLQKHGLDVTGIDNNWPKETPPGRAKIAALDFCAAARTDLPAALGLLEEAVGHLRYAHDAIHVELKADECSACGFLARLSARGKKGG